MVTGSTKPRILHCLPDTSSVPALAERAQELGLAASQDVVFAKGSATQIQDSLRSTPLAVTQNVPEISGKPGPGKLNVLAQSLAAYDLVLTYEWETINVALAHRVFGQYLSLPVLIHHEFEFDEASEAKLKRKFLRRIAHGSTAKFVSQSPAVGQFAQNHWGIAPTKHVQTLPEIDLKRFRPSAKAEALPGLVKRSHEFWIGAHVDSENKTAARNLVHVLTELPNPWQLVIRADQAQILQLRNVADDAELSHRVHFLDLKSEEPVALALCDLFVDLAGAFAPPILAMKAMASANVVITARDSAAAQVTGEQRGNLIVENPTEAHLTKAILSFVGNPGAMTKAGKSNRDFALAEFGGRNSNRQLVDVYRAELS